MLNNRVDFIGDLYVLLSISFFKNSFFLQRSFLIKTLQVEVVAGLEDLGGETGSSLMSELSFFGNLDDRSSLSWRWCCCCCCCCCAVNLAFKNSSSSLLERLRNMFEDEDEMGCCMTSRGWCTLTTSRECCKCDVVTTDDGDLSIADPAIAKAGFCTAMIWPSRDETT